VCRESPPAGYRPILDRAMVVACVVRSDDDVPPSRINRRSIFRASERTRLQGTRRRCGVPRAGPVTRRSPRREHEAATATHLEGGMVKFVPNSARSRPPHSLPAQERQRDVRAEKYYLDARRWRSSPPCSRRCRGRWERRRIRSLGDPVAEHPSESWTKSPDGCWSGGSPRVRQAKFATGLGSRARRRTSD